MSIIDKIKSRNSNPFFDDKPVEKNLIEQLLDAAVCTPVHYNTHPWRFLVLQGNARNRFGEFISERMASSMDTETRLASAAKLEKMKAKPLRAPVVIVAAAAQSTNPKALMVENIASVNVGCQNILLAAEELGLAAMWRTGSMTYAEDVVDYLGFDKGSKLVAFLYLGYPAQVSKSKPRKTSAQFTRWDSD